MDGTDFIKVSEHIVNLGPGGSRSATSRAYYGAFHLSLSFMERHGIRIQGRSHGDPPRFLQKSPHPDGVAAGRLLGDLQSRRVKADYDLQKHSHETVDYGRYSIELAKSIQKHLEEFGLSCGENPTLLAAWIGEVEKLSAIGRGR